MIYLGIDPGVATVGYGVVLSVKNSITPISWGIIKTPPDMPFPKRLNTIFCDMVVLIDKFKPDAAAVEELFFNTNVTTGIQVGHARGVILLALEQGNIPTGEYTPLQIKQAVVGYGRAEKKQVMELTRQQLGLDAMPRPDDAADALAIALCHARSTGSSLYKYIH